jgi:hypothetical protein
MLKKVTYIRFKSNTNTRLRGFEPSSEIRVGNKASSDWGGGVVAHMEADDKRQAVLVRKSCKFAKKDDVFDVLAIPYGVLSCYTLVEEQDPQPSQQQNPGLKAR